MELNKIREMTEVELAAELEKMKKDLFNLRFQHVTGQLENPLKMKETKRDIARVKTIIREKELAKAKETEESPDWASSSATKWTRPSSSLWKTP